MGRESAKHFASVANFHAKIRRHSVVELAGCTAHIFRDLCSPVKITQTSGTVKRPMPLEVSGVLQVNVCMTLLILVTPLEYFSQGRNSGGGHQNEYNCLIHKKIDIQLEHAIEYH